MSTAPFKAPARPVLPTTRDGVHLEPHRIFCIGKNYADHVREMGGDPSKQDPVLFSKPVSAIIPDGETISYPPMTEDLHYEGELVLVLESGGADISEADALDHVWGYACGNDLTRRDLQALSKTGGHPWDMAKGFDRSAVIGPMVPKDEVSLDDARLSLTVNGVEKQGAPLTSMIWSVPAIIACLSRYVTLEPGDVIFTGTPEGVGPLVPGDTCTVAIDGLPSCTVAIA